MAAPKHVVEKLFSTTKIERIADVHLNLLNDRSGSKFPITVFVHKLRMNFPTENLRSPLQRFQSHIAIRRIEDAIKLITAGFHQLGHTDFGYAFFLHFFGELPGDNFFDCLRASFFKESFFLHKVVKARRNVRIV